MSTKLLHGKPIEHSVFLKISKHLFRTWRYKKMQRYNCSPHWYNRTPSPTMPRRTLYNFVLANFRCFILKRVRNPYLLSTWTCPAKHCTETMYGFGSVLAVLWRYCGTLNKIKTSNRDRKDGTKRGPKTFLVNTKAVVGTCKWNSFHYLHLKSWS